MPAIQGLRGTGQFDVDFRPTNYRELFTLLEPNGTAPLNALLSMASSEATDDPKYNNFRDELPDRVVTVNFVAGYDAAVGTLTLDATDAVAFCVAGTLLYNTRTGEVMRVSVDGNPSTGAVTVERNKSGTAFTILDGDALAVVGFADKENGNSPTPVTFDSVVDFNYTQIFKTAVALSNTLDKTYLRTGSKEAEMLTKGLKLHMSDIERAMFFGRRAIENANTSEPTRYTGGLIHSITNVVDAASGFTTANVITENEFDRLLIENLFSWGSKEKIAFVGPRVASNMTRIAKDRWAPTQVDNSYGVSFSRYSTFAGDLLVYLHPMFRQIPLMSSSMVVLDVPHIKYRHMKDRDTDLKRDIQGNDQDGKKHQYVTECGLEMTSARPHALIKNWGNVVAP